MKRKILISTLLLLTGLVTHAQDLDIKPSQQAQGLLESKNAMVDHATGLFHYKAPLYEIKSGNFTLPISLNYIAKGVKVQDQPGLIGYNWTLNTGGVVTRTIRGGIADETIEGYARNPFLELPTDEEKSNINKRKMDGESDIFSVSFNGQNINFIIKYDKINKKIIVELLEKSNVKIECNYDSILSQINGWVVTDENGNKYTFNQQEWTTCVNRENPPSNNGISNKKYISSWYINKIEPINCKPIVYSYLDDLKSGSEGNIAITNYYTQNRTLFKYNPFIYDYPFDFNKYRSEFYSYIDLAAIYLQNLSITIQTEISLQGLESGTFLTDPTDQQKWNSEDFNTNFKILGILSNFDRISNVSTELFDVINNLINIYGHLPSSDASAAAVCFENAKSVLKRCMNEKVALDTKEQFSGSTYSIKTPLLSNISYNDNTIEFSYDKTQYYSRLEKITKFDNQKKMVNSVVFDSKNNLNNIIFTDSKGNGYNKIKLNYFSSTDNLIPDLWGYYKKKVDYYTADSDIENAKNKTISSIIELGRNEIQVDYELNKIKAEYCKYVNYGYENFGGIRISKIIIKDLNNLNSINTIKYRYPIDGDYVYPWCFNEEINNKDEIIYDHIINIGNAYINTGNNGLYYSYVEEELVGKGTNTYQFLAVCPNEDFRFWLYGLNIATASYDLNNRLISIKKNIYFADEESSVDYPENIISNNSINNQYNKYVPQIKADRKYVDIEALEEYFSKQNNIPLFTDGATKYFFDVYNQIYIPNIRPRVINSSYYCEPYRIVYGGKVLLKEQIEYRFENELSNNISPSHFKRVSNNYLKTEYVYDNQKYSTNPTQIIKTNSNGQKSIEVLKRVTEISESADPMISRLKNYNILNAVIKKQKLIANNTQNTYKLIEENIYKYDNKEINNKNVFVLDKIYTRYSQSSANYNITFPDKNLFEFGMQNYNVSKTMLYNLNNESIVPVLIKTNEDEIALKYDPESDDAIMKSNSGVIMNIPVYYKKHIYVDNIKYDECKEIYVQSKDFYEKYIATDFNDCIDQFINYQNSIEHINILKLIKIIADLDENASYTYLKSLVDEYITRSNLDMLAYNYIQNYYNYHGPNVYITPQICGNLIDALGALIMDENYFDIDTYNSLLMFKKKNSSNVNDLVLTNVEPDKKYNLYVLSDLRNYYYSSYDINYKISYPTKDEDKSVKVNRNNYIGLSVFKIDNSGPISSISVNIPDCSYIYYIALVPEDAEFEAISYNADGTIFCKFNQNGQLERYDYDTAGRVIKVYDNDNNVLKEFKYNVVL